MAESNGWLWDKQPGPDWLPEDYLREAGRQTHRDYLPSSSLCLGTLGITSLEQGIIQPTKRLEKFEELGVERKHTYRG